MDILEIWPELFVSPFGVVDKGDGDPQATGRVIHDLSHPDNASVNSNTECSDIAAPAYEHCSRIAREISRCKATDPAIDIELMAGDVTSAYRNACIHSESVHLFAGLIPEDNAIVIDMSAAFGWTGSAGTYGVLGGAVAHIHGNTCNSAYPGGFFNYHWVDDHVNVAANTGSRCAEINRSLRYAMTSVMGPAAVNEDKFTAWGTRQHVLGLLFDTRVGTVAMPPAKIAKARNLVACAFHATSLSRTELRSLLGSLRHVATRVRPAQAFLQRLRSGEIGLHRRRRVAITNDVRADLEWWWHILAEPALNGVPLDYFGALPEPDFVVATDASDEGLCALVPALHLELTYRFTPEERALIADFHRGAANEFDINYRELLSCVLAVQAWAQTWRQTRSLTQRRPLHVHFRIDNTSAVSWQSKMSSRNGRAQVLIRLLSLWEHTFGLRFSASHIPGVDNITADAGSRRWGSDRLSTLFAELTSGWTTTTAPGSIREIENVWHNISDSTQSQIPRSPGTRSFDHWKQWAARRGINWQLSVSTPRAVQLLSEFIIDCSLHGFGSNRVVRSSTVKSNLFGIRHFIVASGGVFPIDYPQIRMLLKGVARFDAPGRQKAPASVAILEAIFQSLNLHDPADQALWGVLCMAFFFLLRRSQIVSTSSSILQWFALRGNDISVADDGGAATEDPKSAMSVCIRLRGSKTNQDGKPVTRMLTRSGHPFLCPVLGALLLRQARARLPETIPAAVFLQAGGTPSCVSADRVVRALKAGAATTGENPRRFSTHSLRSGGATNMYRSGVDALTIQFHGRWASDAFKLYTRLCSESVADIASRIVSGPRASTVLR